ncbi:hypothetical protein SO802_012527 [Lithocarpus litseifolius]|uniref:RNase H type-1 domain-containing protein n=1 Tax=Lithocarpus litseifolius TaxID=425828 RepID=A0AAW2D6Y9_9ROSI
MLFNASNVWHNKCPEHLFTDMLYKANNNKSHDLKFVKDKLENKLSGWKSKNLSWAGRATLINFVAQSIPTYTMASLQFPKNLCDQLDAVVCSAKLAKASSSHQCLSFWKSLVGSVASGNSIRIWEDPWVLDLPNFIPKTKDGVNLDEILLVSQLLNSDHMRWDINKLMQWFEIVTIESILKIPISLDCSKDNWIWTPIQSVWKLRNKIHFEGMLLEFDVLEANILRLWIDHKRIRVSAGCPLVSTPSVQSWSPLARYSIKINVDAAVGPNSASIATVVRDWRGELVFVLAPKKLNTTLPFQVEAEAIEWALLLAESLEAVAISIEPNSKQPKNLATQKLKPTPTHEQERPTSIHADTPQHRNPPRRYDPFRTTSDNHSDPRVSTTMNRFDDDAENIIRTNLVAAIPLLSFLTQP